MSVEVSRFPPRKAVFYSADRDLSALLPEEAREKRRGK